MKIYNQDKTQELNRQELDFEKGYLRHDKLFVAHHDATEAIAAVYEDRIVEEESGGISIYKDLVTPAVEAKEAWDEYEEIQVYVLFSEQEVSERKIAKLKAKLRETDYQAIKFSEGEMSLEDYAEMKENRAAWRQKINELEEVLYENGHN